MKKDHIKRNEPKADANLGTILSNLFLEVAHVKGVTPDDYNAWMETYLSTPSNFEGNRVPDNVKDRSNIRSNLLKDLTAKTMTFRVFIKSIKFLQIPKIKISVDVYHANDEITHHERTLDLRDYSMNKGSDDE